MSGPNTPGPVPPPPPPPHEPETHADAAAERTAAMRPVSDGTQRLDAVPHGVAPTHPSTPPAVQRVSAARRMPRPVSPPSSPYGGPAPRPAPPAARPTLPPAGLPVQQVAAPGASAEPWAAPGAPTVRHAPVPQPAAPTVQQPPVTTTAQQPAVAPYAQPAPYAPQQPGHAPGYAPQPGYPPQHHAAQQPPAYAHQPAAPAPQYAAPHAAPHPAYAGPGQPAQQARRRRLSPGWIAFIVFDVALVAVLGVVVWNLFGGSPATEDGPGAGTASVAPSDEPTEEAPPAQTLASFAAPSGNITCEITTAAVTCSIAELNQQPAPVEGCDGTTGYRVTIEAATGEVDLPCVPPDEQPTPAPQDVRRLEYGQSVTEGQFTCNSEQSGMQCRDDRSGRGFTVARAGIGSF
ncbi:hypothetical protein DNL40_02145 [Xylanimonas oleitrophica]|uniref:Uncharacterized protein n=1 Tax=Xylanimonas oleitrophica TaxID=2607479 RepID=A0A2W5Y9A1_9MICO|nr:hypothetical protein [Xylanimonas oleitrophica]PZR55194.1 hypothetical protein DNL40_02145 [Xylanimonas oleitrophica]